MADVERYVSDLISTEIEYEFESDHDAWSTFAEPQSHCMQNVYLGVQEALYEAHCEIANGEIDDIDPDEFEIESAVLLDTMIVGEWSERLSECKLCAASAGTEA